MFGNILNTFINDIFKEIVISIKQSFTYIVDDNKDIINNVLESVNEILLKGNNDDININSLQIVFSLLYECIKVLINNLINILCQNIIDNITKFNKP